MKTLTKIFILVISITFFHNTGFSQWASVTSGTSNFLTSIQGISSTINYAAGFSGTVLKSTNSGQTWTALTSPSSSNINKMFFPPTGNATTGWAASVSGFYKTTNGGTSWTQQIASVVFADLLFTDLNTGMALTTASNLRITTNGGTNFTQVNFTSNAAIHGEALAIGNSSTFFLLGLDNVTDTSYVFKSTNSGSSWSLVFHTPLDYFNLTFVNANTGIICGDNGIMKRTTNGGTSWTTINTGITDDLQGVKFISSTKVYAVGSAGNILKSTDAGLTWVHQTSNTSANLRDVEVFSSDDIGYAVGSGGTIVRTTNGGNGTTGMIQETGETPDKFSLSQNYPNPFNPSTNIEFRIASSGLVQIKIFDILGKEIAVVVNENMKPGTYNVSFDAASLPSETYFYRITAGNYSETKKMILIK